MFLSSHAFLPLVPWWFTIQSAIDISPIKKHEKEQQQQQEKILAWLTAIHLANKCSAVFHLRINRRRSSWQWLMRSLLKSFPSSSFAPELVALRKISAVRVIYAPIRNNSDYVYRWSWASGRMRALQFLIYVVLYAPAELVQSHTILHPQGRRNKWTKVRGSVWTHSVNYLSCCPHALPESNKDLNQLTRQQKNFCFAKWNNDWA